MTLARHKVQIVSTGGTFEKTYHPPTESLRLAGASCIPGILQTCAVEDLPVHALPQVDSQGMDDAMRAALLDRVRGLDGDRFVIVHGTSSMMETARKFQAAHDAATYVFTGAMTPFAYAPVEAAFNLGGAVALAATLPHGVYVYMHGEIFDPEHATKDVARARMVRVG